MAIHVVTSGVDPADRTRTWQIAVDYNASNLRVGAVLVTNNTVKPLTAEVVRTNGTRHSATWGTGQHDTGVPRNVVTLVPDGERGFTYDGIASWSVSI